MNILTLRRTYTTEPSLRLIINAALFSTLKNIIFFTNVRNNCG